MSNPLPEVDPLLVEKFEAISDSLMRSEVFVSVDRAKEKYAGLKININNATIDDLAKLPGIGPKLAQRIVDYRNQNGIFNSVMDLKKVKGIGDKKLNELKTYIVL